MTAIHERLDLEYGSTGRTDEEKKGKESHEEHYSN
jgi:hypothetical protein